MSPRNSYAVAIGVLVAFGVGGLTAAAFYSKAPRTADPTVAFANNAPALDSSLTPSAATNSQENTITVVGSGTATGVPDEAIVGLGVQVTRSNVNLALSGAAVEMGRLIATLHKQGVADKDIQTSSISIYQQQGNCCPATVIGYVSTNQVSVTIHHLSNVSPIIEAAAAAVGNDIQLNGVSLSINDPSPLVKSARAAAMSDAIARAQTWAALAHHHVGGLVSLSEIVNGLTPTPCNGCGKGGGGGIPIQAGQTDVSVTITAVYSLVA
jgi:uncharacterized protein